MKPMILLLSLVAALTLAGCAIPDRNTLETSTETRSRTTVVKDEIPAEGQRKIPVIEQY